MSMVIQSFDHLHDNRVLCYCADFEAHILHVDTRTEAGENVSVHFTGLLAHWFENVIRDNILFGMDEITVDGFFEQYKDLLGGAVSYGFPACCMRAIGEEQRVVMIQFLDYHNSKEIALLKKLEPDFRIFRFEKDRAAEDVQGAENDEALHKEIFNEIRNAFNFAKKIVDTGECEMLLLDGILECVEKGYLQESDLHEIIGKRPDFMDIILTGTILPAGIAEEAENIYQLVAEKEKE